MTQATPEEALNTHLLLDPTIQEKIFQILTDGFTQDGIPTEDYPHSWVPVNDLAHAILNSTHFKNHLRDVLRKVAIRVEPSIYRKGEFNITLDLSEL